MWKDDAFLLDMLLSAQRIVEFTAGVDEAGFRHDGMMQHAVMRLIQIIGEAARKISSETRDAHPEIPWKKIVGMRHRLVHDYFRINLDQVWTVVRDDIPGLIPLLKTVVPPDSE
jgi:uncharacterized protein with HEPN domain